MVNQSELHDVFLASISRWYFKILLPSRRPVTQLRLRLRFGAVNNRRPKPQRLWGCKSLVRFFRRIPTCHLSISFRAFLGGICLHSRINTPEHPTWLHPLFYSRIISCQEEGHILTVRHGRHVYRSPYRQKPWQTFKIHFFCIAIGNSWVEFVFHDARQ